MERKNEDYKHWDNGQPCPYCGYPEEKLNFDLIETDDGVHHDVVDCPNCKKRLFYED